MLLPILLLIVGLVILIGGAEYLVRGSSSMAKKLGVSSIVIGLTVVAFGTSTPELVVNVISAIKGTTDLAIGNVVGSNLANILLILGVGATIRTLKVKEGTTFKEIPFALLAIALVAVMGNDLFFDGPNCGAINVLSRIDGMLLFTFFVIFMYYTYGLSKIEGESEGVETYRLSISVAMVLLGLAGLIIGGKLIVDNAVTIAVLAGLSEGLIGLTVVAIGTSLPELATTIVAVKKGHTDLAIGNVIGSNIFNVFMVLGISAMIRPLPFNPVVNTDVIFTTTITILLFMFMFLHSKHHLNRWQGALFVVLYFSYLTFAFLR